MRQLAVCLVLVLAGQLHRAESLGASSALSPFRCGMLRHGWFKRSHARHEITPSIELPGLLHSVAFHRRDPPRHSAAWLLCATPTIGVSLGHFVAWLVCVPSLRETPHSVLL